MRQRLQQTWSRLRSNTSGGAAILAAIGMPVLIGSAGLAVDTAQWFMWKRELQYAVDQAAIGGAWARSNTKARDTYRTRALREFNANLTMTEDFASTPTVELGYDSEGTDNEVRVSATATKTLPFSGIVMGRGVTIAVQAVAQYRDGANFNACLVALAEDEDDVLNIGGNATVNARCGLAALSCEDDAVVIDGSATVTTDSIATCGTADVDEDLEDVLTEGVEGLEDIYKDLAPPDNPDPQNYECKGKGKNAIATLDPGTYTGGLVVKCATVLNPGIYVIDGGDLDLAANYNVTGTNVMFVLKNGAKLKWGGSGNDNRITLTPMEQEDFEAEGYSADAAAQYDKMLVFEHRDNNPPNPGHILNGNSDSVIEGLMYMPSGEITIVGTADVASECLQISAWKIKVSGGANLSTLCPVDETTSVGTSLADVRLIK